jgi:hypothetical protein
MSSSNIPAGNTLQVLHLGNTRTRRDGRVKGRPRRERDPDQLAPPKRMHRARDELGASGLLVSLRDDPGTLGRRYALTVAGEAGDLPAVRAVPRESQPPISARRSRPPTRSR